MVCPTPHIPKGSFPGQFYGTKRSIKHVEVDLGFDMDNVDAVKNLSRSGINSMMTYYQDPVVYNFTEPNAVKKFKGEVLVFEVSKSLQLF